MPMALKTGKIPKKDKIDQMPKMPLKIENKIKPNAHKIKIEYNR